MSDVPLPSPDFVYGQKCADPQGFRLIDYYVQDTVRRYGDARAAEARRLALLEAAKVCYDMAHEPSNCVRGDQLKCYERLRALADDASPKQVIG